MLKRAPSSDHLCPLGGAEPLVEIPHSYDADAYRKIIRGAALSRRMSEAKQGFSLDTARTVACARLARGCRRGAVTRVSAVLSLVTECTDRASGNPPTREEVVKDNLAQ
ncbi:unnamed protein product [Lampetra planeri]